MAEELPRTSLRFARARDGNLSTASAFGKLELKPPTKGGFFARAPTVQARVISAITHLQQFVKGKIAEK
jgi:hypothetical protein